MRIPFFNQKSGFFSQKNPLSDFFKVFHVELKIAYVSRGTICAKQINVFYNRQIILKRTLLWSLGRFYPKSITVINIKN